jgi:S-sulfo-L-cysteine synthase (O-acetyl-L-serine-dependent)
MAIGDLRSAPVLIGRTPLVRLSTFERETPGVELYAKAEWHNPSGSVKARAAGRILDDAERSGLLTHNRTILDASSGNTGIAYAMIGASRGYRVAICLPANVTPERVRALRSYGAEVLLTDPLEGSDGAIRTARARFAAAPSKYFYADQYNNDANWRAHYDTTAPEIWAETNGRITHFIAGLGTSGTFVGTSRRLRQLNPAIRLVSFQPDAPLHGIEGLKHMDSAIVPGIYDPALAHENLRVSTEDSYAMTRRLAVEGIPAGVSSGAAMVAVLRVASRLTHGVIVTIFPDGAERYVSERFWREEA